MKRMITGLQGGTLKPLDDDLQPYTEQVYKRVQSIFDPKALDDMIDDGSKPQTTLLLLSAPLTIRLSSCSTT